MTKSKLYGGQDSRELPTYSISETSHYLQLPSSTLRAWVKGRYYPTEIGQQCSPPLIALPDSASQGVMLLSFINVVEAHVLEALRREHRVTMPKIREALTYLEAHYPSPHPLVSQAFETDGIDLFVEKYGQLINVAQEGQLAMRSILRVYLSRIERDKTGLPAKLYLFTRTRHTGEPRVIAMDPNISFGRPVLTGTGITTAIVAERYKAGEYIEDLAHDYGCSSHTIQEAIRCELYPQAA